MRKVSILALLQAAICLASGCVRLSEPETFVCDSDADCESGQRCTTPGGACVPQDYCDRDVFCAAGQHCVNQRCKPDECTFSTESSDCNGFSCQGGVCRTSCSVQSDCGAGFHCASSQCVPGARFANGQACAQATECNSGTCCAKPSGAVCANSCPAVPDDSCTVSQDCASGYCCLGPGAKLKCSAVPCAGVPECIGNDDCALGKICVNQKCQTPPSPKLPGETCKADSECKSGSCVADVCRGTAGEYDDCKVDTDCEARRVCCKSTSDFDEPNYCGELDRGCAGSIGDLCEFDFQCIDNDCNANFSGFCSKPCTTNADCGVSPWGVPNACETNGLGDKICFPGCTSTQQCFDNLNIKFECYDALDSASKICADG